MDARSATMQIRTGMKALQTWDEAALAAATQIPRRGIAAVLVALTRAGDTAGWLVHALVLLVALPVETAVVGNMAAAAAFATVGSQAAKRFFRRPRPSCSIAGFRAIRADPDPYSFPSGHSTVAFAVATAATATEPGLGVVEALLACGIAVSRVGLGAHYPVDVLGGAALGLACGIATVGVFG